MQCPECKRKWRYDSAQSICVELNGACLTCKRFRLTRSELDRVLREEKKRMDKKLEGDPWVD